MVEVRVKHYSDEQWADFARKLTSEAEAKAMQKHLNDGCKECAGTFAIWQGVSAFASAERAFAPPDNAVRIAKAQFDAAMPKSSGVRLVFDSLLQPATAGVRGSIAARQFLYETDEYYIDLRLEPQIEANRACVVGQVLKRSGRDRAAQGVPVRLQEGRLAVAHTSTNEFGEFQIETAAEGSLCISITREQADDIILPLYGVKLNAMKHKDLD